MSLATEVTLQDVRGPLDWARSEEFQSTFENGDGDPAPELLIGATFVSTYRKTWGNQPSNDDIVDALDETMADIEERRAEGND